MGADPREREDERAAGLCNTLGYHLQMIGDYAGARPYFERVLGPDHPDTARSLNNLDFLAYYEGDLAAARSYLARALAIYEQRLGPEHPDTRRIRASLAYVVAAGG